MVLETVGRIEKLLSESDDLQKEFVEKMCGNCKAPCCSRVHYLYNDKDIIFLKLSGRALTWRRESFTKKGCWFLDEKGCTLDLKSRPFLCHTYLCDDLKTEMNRQDPEIMVSLKKKFKCIDEMRSQLWAEYLDEKP